ncbi:MAG: hypothetical protein RL711_1910 [Bacteroidota bacterium]
MKEYTCFSQSVPTFHGNTLPEDGNIIGYAAIIETLQLDVSIPDTISIISRKNRMYEIEGWKVFTPRHQPEENLYKQLVFALKYEGVNLLFFKKLFDKIAETEVLQILSEEPTGIYSRKLWFLYEWLMQKTLPIDNLKVSNYTPLIDEKQQFPLNEGVKSSRHRIINNLPGTVDFCPLIFKTNKLLNYQTENIANKNKVYLNEIHKDVLQRASAFLLLKDSKASFTIEGENPSNNRAVRWGKAIGQAGSKPLDKAELLRLQQIVIENGRFLKMGFREEGGFVGEHDRTTGEPMPDHISAKWQDIEQLMDGLINTYKLLENSNYDAVLAAAQIAFGFVFIHPFVDGNGRVHRYLIHHILAKLKFAQQGIIFPVSAAILNHIDDYRQVLEAYSHPLLDFINWKSTNNNNIEVLNDTIDYYRYFDATKQAEFLYDCTNDTIEHIIPNEVNYLIKYDDFKKEMDDQYEMPDQLVAMLVLFLQQNKGVLSKRAREKEFSALNEGEVKHIEKVFQTIFL